MIKINKRQEYILAYIKEHNEGSISDLLSFLQNTEENISKITVNRDINVLLDLKYLEKKGKGRALVYILSATYKVLYPVNVEEYFQTEFDQRKINQQFDFSVFDMETNIFNEDEIIELEALNTTYRKHKQQLSSTLLQKEYERLMIELSWKSSQLEGNTYSLLDTEVLLKEAKEAPNHSHSESVMLLNHKFALEYIQKNADIFKDISVAKVEDVHSLLTKDLGISRNLRKTMVRIVGTEYLPLDNEFQIREALEKTCVLVNKAKNPFDKVVLLMVCIAYIQAFEDGNKRTSRLMGNALLFAYDICPLSFRGVENAEYKKAVVLFYEQQNISYFKELFKKQFEFAVHHYFRV
ncbi:Fic family protein [Patescibacteria group bacterium]|nr:Fic family protein [Patescibacteria group bacterium]MBU1722172.1 Fic family protein [Patescibacteria group bacterium]MBU1901123.1 Fic family protein [Patescibacteria group bacterium]